MYHVPCILRHKACLLAKRSKSTVSMKWILLIWKIPSEMKEAPCQKLWKHGWTLSHCWLVMDGWKGWVIPRVRKTLSARQQCWPESFWESGKFLRHAHYWLRNFQIIWKIPKCCTKYQDKSVRMICKVSGQSEKCPDNLENVSGWYGKCPDDQKSV